MSNRVRNVLGVAVGVSLLAVFAAYMMTPRDLAPEHAREVFHRAQEIGRKHIAEQEAALRHRGPRGGSMPPATREAAEPVERAVDAQAPGAPSVIR